MIAHALQHHQGGRLREAEAGYRAVLAREPAHVDALYLLGVLLHQTRRSAEAIEWVQRAIARNASRPEFFNTLGDAQRTEGAYALAESSFRQALALRVDYTDAQLNLARTLHAQGKLEETLVLLFEAVAAQPTEPALRHLLASMLHGVALGSANQTIRQVLLELCTDDSIGAESIAGAVLGLVASSDAFRAVADACQRGDDPLGTQVAASMTVMTDSLLIAILPRIVVHDASIERVLTALRYGVLVGATERAEAGDIPPAMNDFAIALARQCFNTEYAFATTIDEEQRVAALARELSAQLSNTANTIDIVDDRLTVFAMYAPLHALRDWERLLDVDASCVRAPLGALIRAHVVDHARECSLAAQLSSAAAVSDEVSIAVREQYESNPYPRWLTLPQSSITSVTALISALRPDHALPRAPHTILVAGCGTGQQALTTARSFPEAEVTAFDLSAASLAYASRMAEALEARNVHFARGDIMQYAGHDGEFSIVACSGVLHHLADPMAGWERLLAALAPNGVMKIGLYSTIARRAVAAARAFVAEHHFASDARGIRACRQAILALPDTHPARAVAQFADFFSLSGCRDLVMHVHERTYTIPDLAECLTARDLAFLGFQLPQPVQAQFVATHGAGALNDLTAWDAFEHAHPHTFAAMYQFWCARQTD